MATSGKSSERNTGEQLLSALERNTRGKDEDRTDDANIRYYEIDGRALPVVLTAEALKAVKHWTIGSDAAPLLAELHRCADGLLRLREQLPASARQRFDELDDLIQYLDLQLCEDPKALASNREVLIERICALGDLLMTLIWPRSNPEDLR